MKRYMNRRGLGLLGVLLASQLLSACIIVPRPYHRRHVIVHDGQPGNQAPSHGGYRDGREWGRR
jgi:hypothetical protein